MGLNLVGSLEFSYLLFLKRRLVADNGSQTASSLGQGRQFILNWTYQRGNQTNIEDTYTF